jgi:Protein of unknown function (DUF2874).
MKTLILSIAILFGLGFTADAFTTSTNPSTSIVAQEDGFKEVKFEELSADAQKAIAEDYKNFTIKKVFYNAELKQIRLVIVTNDDQKTEHTLLLDEKGKPVATNTNQQ